ncbi:MAG: protease modulator HflC [Chloroflexi bacterium]|nr:protease modulator HflC [Chloroflexota bacterium]
MNTPLSIVLGFLAIALIARTQLFFVVSETDQAIVMQLGRYVYTASEPGLYLKTPFAQSVFHMERRLLTTDAPPQEYLTLDKKRLRVDHVTFWRIVDPLQYYVTVRTEAGARARLDDVVFSELRRQLAVNNFDAIIAQQREPIMDAVSASVRVQAASFGIQVEDVRIKRADLPKEVEESVFNRMRAERSREANRYRAEGEEQKAEIQAAAERERAILLADAREHAERLRGDGDAQAIRIFAAALNEDPEFYSFRRRLEAYERVLNAGDTIVIPSDSGFFGYLVRPAAADSAAPPPAARPARSP